MGSGYRDHLGEFQVDVIVSSHDELVDRAFESENDFIDALEEVPFEFAGVDIDHVHSDEGGDFILNFLVEFPVFGEGEGVLSPIVRACVDPLLDGLHLIQKKSIFIIYF